MAMPLATLSHSESTLSLKYCWYCEASQLPMPLL